jgi:NADH-quinone oxidoreductase subunit N
MNTELGLRYLLPEIFLVFSGIMALVIDMLRRGKNKKPVAYWSIITFIVTAVLLLERWREIGFFMNGLGRLNPVVNLFGIVFLAAALLTVLLSISYLERLGYGYGEFYSLLIFSVLGMFIMASAADLLVFFLGLELMSIPLYIMTGLFRTKKESNEAAIKYLIMGAFSTAFILYGIALMFGAVGTTKYIGIAQAISAGDTVSQSAIFLLSLILIIVGFSFKLAIAPFHMWTPDVYQGAPTPLTGFMSVAVKGAAYAALFSVLAALFSAKSEWTVILQFLAIVTMTWGNVAALRQQNIKRMLAYSSIAHSGYILVGITAYGNLETANISLAAVIFYLAIYLFMNIGAFGAAMVVAGKDDQEYLIDGYKGLSRRKPFLALALAVFMFSLMGIPPLAGFAAKFQVFYAAIKAGFVSLAVVAVLNSVVSVYYYLRIVLYMYMEKDGQERDISRAAVVERIVIGLLAAAILVFGLFPSLIMEVVTKAIGF